jgi:Mn-dependent DtxR family transcriptional regulator
MRVANKCGFIVYEGARHSKIKTPESVFITTISRHLKIKKEVVKAIIKRLKEFGAEIETRN